MKVAQARRWGKFLITNPIAIFLFLSAITFAVSQTFLTHKELQAAGSVCRDFPPLSSSLDFFADADSYGYEIIGSCQKGYASPVYVGLASQQELDTCLSGQDSTAFAGFNSGIGGRYGIYYPTVTLKIKNGKVESCSY